VVLPRHPWGLSCFGSPAEADKQNTKDHGFHGWHGYESFIRVIRGLFRLISSLEMRAA
jgi:hypothetical protein